MRLPVVPTLSTTGARRPSATRISASPPKADFAGGCGEPVGAAPATRAEKRRRVLRLQLARRPLTMRTPPIVRRPEPIVPSTWPRSTHEKRIRLRLPRPIPSRRAALPANERPSNATTLRPTTV